MSMNSFPYTLNQPKQVALFDYYGVVGQDPLAIWAERHQLLGHLQVAELCKQIDAGKIELLEFYQGLGELSGQKVDNTRAELESVLAFDQKLLDLIQIWRGKGVKVGLLSNSHRTLHQSLWNHGIHHYFDDVLTSQEIQGAYPKPDPRLFYHALLRLGGAPETAVFFDDRQNNVDGARAAGLCAELYTMLDSCLAYGRSHGWNP